MGNSLYQQVVVNFDTVTPGSRDFSHIRIRIAIWKASQDQEID